MGGFKTHTFAEANLEVQEHTVNQGGKLTSPFKNRA